MRLRSIAINGQYKGIENQLFDFSVCDGNIIALVGLNGTGKSQLLELIAESFAYLERCIRPDYAKGKGLGFDVILQYQWDLSKEISHAFEYLRKFSTDNFIELKIKLNSHERVEMLVLNDGEWFGVEHGGNIPIPYVIGYSSGLNENLQRGFLKNVSRRYATRRILFKRKQELAIHTSGEMHSKINLRYIMKYPHLFYRINELDDNQDYLSAGEVSSPTSRMIYLDYDNLGLLLFCLSVSQTNTLRKTLTAFLKRQECIVNLEYDLRSGIIDEDAIRDINNLLNVVGSSGFSPQGKKTTDEQFEVFGIDFLAGTITFDLQDEKIMQDLREVNYNDPLTLFLRLQNIQQLGIRNLTHLNRIRLSKDNFMGTVKKPLKTKLPLSVAKMQVRDNQGNLADYDDLSDGELQMIQILSALSIFKNKPAIFLLDEPETHLNPTWRSQYFHYVVQAMQTDDTLSSPQILVTTHSPFMISSLTQENVLLLKKSTSGEITIDSILAQSYGASLEVITKEIFGMISLTPKNVIEDIRQRLVESSLDEVREWVQNEMGDSLEKSYLLSRLKQ